MSESHEFTFDVAQGDPGASRQLRKSLLAIKSATTDSDVRRQIDDVLSGKASMRSFGTSETFARIVDSIPQHQLDRTLAMPEDERQRLAVQGERELDRLRQSPEAMPAETEGDGTTEAPESSHPPAPSPAGSPTISGTRKPNREQLYTPDEPDDDDLYFQERRNNGWLQ